MLSHMADFFSFLSFNNIPVCVCVCVYYIIFISSSVDGHVDCFHILALVNNAVMTGWVQVSLQVSDFVTFCIPRGMIAG